MSLVGRISWALPIALVSFAACTSEVPDGHMQTPAGSGPGIVWDIQATPFPHIPLPNDVGTWPDPDSPTGLRLNASMVAPTVMEHSLRERLDRLDGWGTYQAISVAFHELLDLRAMSRRHADRGRFDDDAVYIVDLETGLPVPFDVGSGGFEFDLKDTDFYFENDVRSMGTNILFDTVEEDTNRNGVLDPGEDTDFDGVLDHPNTLSGNDATPYDDLLTWYERETNTLILRPFVPLAERRTYAVVLTDRLVGEDGQPVRSPFASVHHPDQRRALESLSGWLARRPDLYGDLSTRGWNGVAMAWTFTTQSVTGELRSLRDGLYGNGTFASLATQFPAESTFELTVAEGGDGCELADNVYRIDTQEILPVIETLANAIFGLSAEATAQLLRSYDAVDHLALAFVRSPYLLGDPEASQLDDSWDVQPERGYVRVTEDRVPVLMVIPKATPGHQQPFPTVMYGHGTGLVGLEGLSEAGFFAQHGLATVAITGPSHGLPLNRTLERTVLSLFDGVCHEPLGRALLDDRAEDIDGDEIKDTAGDYWTAFVFRTRDMVRQHVLDTANVVRILRSFDGVRRGQDLNGDGSPDVFGDIDLDGVPDLGGPATPFFATGRSMGGITSMVLAGIEPSVVAAAPVSGGGGMADLTTRSQQGGLKEAVYLRLAGPFVVGTPASTLDTEGPPEERNTTCDRPTDRSIRVLAPNVVATARYEVACLSADRLQPGDAVMLTNLINGEARCSGVREDGRFRVSVPSDADDLWVFEIWQDGTEYLDFRTCARPVDRQPLEVIDRFRVGSDECTECARYQRRTWSAGSSFVAPTYGFAMPRQTPDFRRFSQIAQAGLERGDPINYARGVFLEPIAQDDGSRVSRAVMVLNNLGDFNVPVSAGDAYARAAGIVPFLPTGAPDDFAEYRATPQMVARIGDPTPLDLLARTHVTEGIPRLERHPGSQSPQTLFDPDDFDEGLQGFGEQTLDRPLRLVRRSMPVRASGTWWPDVTGDVDGDPLSALVHAMSEPFGAHAIPEPADPSEPWDDGVYYFNLIGRFFASRGRDVYYQTHPDTHHCLEDVSCPEIRQFEPETPTD